MKKIIDSIVKLKAVSQSTSEGSAIGSFNIKQLYGGNLIGQSISAGYSKVDKDIFLHNVNACYLKKGVSTEPLQYTVINTTKSRTFTRLSMSCTQQDKHLASFTLSFKKPELSDAYVYELPVKEPKPFDKCMNYSEVLSALKGAPPHVAKEMEGIKNWLVDFPFSLRPIDMGFLIPTKVDESVFSYWFQLKEKIDPSEVDVAMKHTLIGFMSDYGMLFPIVSLRKKSILGFVTSLDHNIWFHQTDFDINQKFCFLIKCINAGGCLTLNFASILTEDMTYIATIAQQGLLREHRGTKTLNTPFS